jgi:hypothetical protein
MIMPSEPKSILLFDDDYEGMLALKNVLQEIFGYRVELTAAQTLPERLNQERFDLVCVDLMIHPISFDADGNEVHNVHFSGVNWQNGPGISSPPCRGNFPTSPIWELHHKRR